MFYQLPAKQAESSALHVRGNNSFQQLRCRTPLIVRLTCACRQSPRACTTKQILSQQAKLSSSVQQQTDALHNPLEYRISNRNAVSIMRGSHVLVRLTDCRSLTMKLREQRTMPQTLPRCGSSADALTCALDHRTGSYVKTGYKTCSRPLRGPRAEVLLGADLQEVDL